MTTAWPSEVDEDRCFRAGLADPLWWIKNVLGDEPWAAQAEILEAVRDHRAVAVKSCNAAGKSWLASRAALWWLYRRPSSIVITTAPTDRQVRTILWKEIRTAHIGALCDLGGDLLQQELKLAPNWFAIGFTAPENDPSRFQGFHEENILVIIDEACGVSLDIYAAIGGILAGGNARLLEIGNPTDPTGPFGDSFRSSKVQKFTISAFDTPNFTTLGITAEDIASGAWSDKIKGDLPKPMLITPEWVAEAHARWGPDSPFYKARVLAEFPAESADTLIPLAHIEAAQRRELKHSSPNVLGVDVARYGGDETVLYHRRGPVARLHGRGQKQDTMQTTGQVIAALTKTGAEHAYVDADGLGAGVVDRMVELKRPVVAIHGGTTPLDRERFLNARAEWYWALRERFEQGDIDIDSQDLVLAAQLSSLRWKLDSRGRVVIESKDDMKRRGLTSPDRADALAYAFAQVGRLPGDHGITI